MGSCPCPRCLTPKDLLDQLGTGRDKNRRARLARIDNLQYRVKVSSARDVIYNQNCAVNSRFVDNILKPESLVPTEVRSILPLAPPPLIRLVLIVECFLL